MNNRSTAHYLAHYAGFTSRLFAFMIDIAFVSLAVVVVSWMAAVIFSTMQLDTVVDYLQNLFPGVETWVYNLSGLLSLGFISFITFFLYQVFFWTFTGYTPGKALMGLRVVRTNGQNVGLLRSIIRYLGYIIAIVPLGLGFLWIIVDDRRQGWQDKLAGTFVVYTWAARPDERFLADELDQAQANHPVSE
jgi:uncharacterized RDD family membrane protein YckC